jgi:hypothetical protein
MAGNTTKVSTAAIASTPAQASTPTKANSTWTLLPLFSWPNIPGWLKPRGLSQCWFPL